MTGLENENSEDFSQEEANSATITTSIQDLAKNMRSIVYTSASFRRWNGHCYCRVATLDKTLVFQIDWLR